MSGADADALDRLGVRLEQSGRHLDRTARQLRSRLNSAPWRGQNADRFRQEFNSVHSRAIADAARFLDDAREALQRNAQEQRDASAVGAPGVAGGGRHTWWGGLGAAAIAALGVVRSGFSLRPGWNPDGFRWNPTWSKAWNHSFWDASAWSRDGKWAATLPGRIPASAQGELHGLHSSSGADASARLSRTGLDASAGAHAEANLADGNISGRVGSDEVNAFGRGEFSAGADAHATAKSHVGLDGISSGIGAGAFAGAKISGTAGADLGGVKPSVTASGYAGIGIHADADVSITPQKVKFQLDAGAALKLGAGVKVQVEIEPERVVRNLARWFHPF